MNEHRISWSDQQIMYWSVDSVDMHYSNYKAAMDRWASSSENRTRIKPNGSEKNHYIGRNSDVERTILRMTQTLIIQ